MIKKQLWLILLCIPCLCTAQIEKYSVKYEQVVLTPEHEQFHSPEVDLYFDSIRQIFNAEMHEVIGHTDQLLPLKDGALPGSLCHFITDVLFDFCDSIVKSENGGHIDMAVLNIGGIRDDMVAGNVTKGNIFSILPFENVATIATMKGSELRKMFMRFTPEMQQPCSHVQVAYTKGKIDKILIDGKLLNDNKIYNVASIDFVIINRGDHIMDDVVYEKVNKTSVPLHDLIINHIKKVKDVVAPTDVRYIIG